MKHLDALVIDVDELQVVELLQQEVARIIQDVAAAGGCSHAPETFS